MSVHLRAILPPLTLIGVALTLAAGCWLLEWPIFAGLFLLGAVILIFDTRGRRKDFHNARNYLARGHDPSQVARTYQYSWCSRAACRAAASLSGAGADQAIADYYRDNGYRWFHIFPDNTFSRHSPFLKLRFWRITLFGNAAAKSVLERAEREAQRKTTPRSAREGVRTSAREAA